MLFCLQYCKGEEVRFLGHLDLMRSFERAFRRAHLPLAFSEGFNPHPRVAYASALALGVTGAAEYLDLELTREISPAELSASLNRVLPSGLKILAAQAIAPRQRSLTALLNLAHYVVTISPFAAISAEKVSAMITQVLARPSYFVSRQGKKGIRQIDLRPGLLHLNGHLAAGKLILQMDLRLGNGGNVRPEEVVQMMGEEILGGEKTIVRVHRLGLYIEEDGQVFSPWERT